MVSHIKLLKGLGNTLRGVLATLLPEGHEYADHSEEGIKKRDEVSAALHLHVENVK